MFKTPCKEVAGEGLFLLAFPSRGLERPVEWQCWRGRIWVCVP